jgi:acyl-CoA synthetase (AMP-forming)/AMP-acid ligase II
MYQELDKAWQQLTSPGQMFEVKPVEVRGVPLRSYALAPPSLRELWLSSAGHGDKTYLVYGEERCSYSESHAMVASVANWLSQQGVGPGDRVAIAMRNYPEWMLAYWAVTAMGAVVVGMNAWWVSEEMRFGLEDSAPKVLIADAERLQRFAGLRDGFPALNVVGVRVAHDLPEWATDWKELVNAPSELPGASIDPDDDACIFYTSGTTGRPKGAQLTHRGCVNNVFNVAFVNAVQSAALALARGATPGEGATPEIRALIATPLFHVTANNCVAQVVTLAGGRLVHMYKWDPAEALRLIEAERVTTFSAVPMMTREIMMHPDFASRDTSSLQTVGGGGAAMQPDLVAKVGERMRGARPNTGYGMTETCGIIAAVGAEFFMDRPTSVGRAMPTFEARCVDPAGSPLPVGDIGELVVRGAPVIKGYLNRPEATAETIVDGWLHTGDIAYMDEDGFIYLVDRAKDMVLRGGENVYCAEVENALFHHPAVAECVAFAVPDDRLGEEVGAAVYLAPGEYLDADSLREHCREHIAPFKVPRYLWFVDEPLPRNANGKFVKRELRERLKLENAA